MEKFNARMTAAFTPNSLFLDFYKWVMTRCLNEDEPAKETTFGAYYELAKTVVDMIGDKTINAIVASSDSIYILPLDESSINLDRVDFFRLQSHQVLTHELAKWFGSEKHAEALISGVIKDLPYFLQHFFSASFFSFYLDFSTKEDSSIYLTISPGKDFKRWLVGLTKKDVKLSLNLMKGQPSHVFDTYTTFVINTELTQPEGLDTYLEQNIETILKYEKIAWLGTNEETPYAELKWPNDINQLTTFKKWFHINVYKDSVRLGHVS